MALPRLILHAKTEELIRCSDFRGGYPLQVATGRYRLLQVATGRYTPLQVATT
jgi:hypothetical protein